MIQKSRFMFLAVTLLLIVILSSCTSQSTTTTANTTTSQGATAADKPQYGGVLKHIAPFGPSNMGVPYAPGSPAELVVSIPAVETLLRMDEKGLPMPWLATDWKVGDDLKSITLSLRKGVKFHDGTDFNAEAVKYNLDMYRESTLPDLKSVKAVDIIDDYTVRLTLSEFQTSIIGTLYSRAGQIVSPTSLKTNGKDYNLLHPVGTGPFKFVSYQRDQLLKFVKFENYWQKGKPYLDGIEVTYAADASVGLMSFESGAAHIFNTTGENQYNLNKTGKYITTSTPNWVSGFVADSANADSPFSKLEVRQAFRQALDMKSITDALGFGLGTEAQQLTAADSWFYDSTIKGYPYNPLKAKELLAAAGYPNGFKTKLTYVNTWNGATNLPPMQAQLKQVGIDVSLDPVSQTVIVGARTNGWKNSLIQFNFAASVGSDFGLTSMQQISSKAAENVSMIRPADVDTKIFQALVEPDNTKRGALYKDIMKLTIDKYCSVTPTTVGRISMTKSKQVHDLRFYEFWYSQWTPEDTWLSQ